MATVAVFHQVQPNELHNEVTRSEWVQRFATTATRPAETAAVLTTAPLSPATFVVVAFEQLEQAAKAQMLQKPLALSNVETVLEQVQKCAMMETHQVVTDAATTDRQSSRDMHELVAV